MSRPKNKYIIILILSFAQIFLYGQNGVQQKINISNDYFNKAEAYLNQRIFDSAAIFYKRALVCERNGNNSPLFKSKCLLRTANAYISDGVIDSANRFIYLSNKIISDHNITSRKVLLESYYIQGHLHYIYSHIDTSKFYLDKSLRLCDTTSNDSLYVLILKDLGNIYFLQHQNDEALSYYKKALTIEKNRKNRSELIIASLYQNMSIIYAKKYEYTNANQYIKTSLEIKKKILSNDDILLINAYINYSVLLCEIGEFKKAMFFNKISEKLVLSKYSKKHFLLGHIYHDKSIILESMGKSNQAIIYVEKAMDQYKKNFSSEYDKMYQILWNMGVLYYSLGEINKSLEYFYLTLEFHQEPRMYLNTLKMIATCQQSLGNYIIANIYYEKCLEKLYEYHLENTPIGSIIYTAFGTYCNIVGRKEEALKFLKKSFDIIQNCMHCNPSLYLFSINNLADYYLDNNNFKNALRYYQLGLNYHYDGFNDLNIYNNPKNFSVNDYTYNLYRIYQGKAQAFLNNYKEFTSNKIDLISCIEACELAINFIDKLKVYTNNEKYLFSVSNNEAKTLELALSAYYELFLITNEKKYLHNAYIILEKTKASYLTNSINGSESIKFSNIPLPLVDQENKLKSVLNYCNQKIESLRYAENQNDSKELQYYEDQRFAAMTKYDSLIDYLEQEYPQYYELKYSNQIISVGGIQENLDSSSALINYTLTDSNIYIAVITSEKFHFCKYIVDTSLHINALSYYRNINKGGNKKHITELSYFLYSVLIAPIENLILNKENLIIIPDSYLNYVPFETLCKPDFQDFGFFQNDIGIMKILLLICN